MVTKVQMLNTKIAELNSKIIELGKIQKVTTDCVHDYYKDNSLVSWETLSSHIVGQWVSAGEGVLYRRLPSDTDKLLFETYFEANTVMHAHNHMEIEKIWLNDGDLRDIIAEVDLNTDAWYTIPSMSMHAFKSEEGSNIFVEFTKR